MPKSNYFKYLRLAECDYHRKASATIIQDPDRAQVLFHDNGMSMSEANIFYVPVSIIGEPYKNRSCFLHDALGIPKHKKVILYFGLIWEKRYALEVAQVAQNFPEDWVLVMHGYAENPSTLEKIKALDRRNRVVLSLELVPSNRIQELVASADIGLALYSPLLQNDRLTAFSSEKVALYMQCGVPFVAFDYPGYRRLANEERCGVVIRSLDDLPKANREILLSYDEFRRRAYQTFHKYYDYCRNFAKVTESVGYLRPASQLGSAALTGVGLTE
jgi:glycosyltransferase involved in cell wall biosynthesis